MALDVEDRGIVYIKGVQHPFGSGMHELSLLKSAPTFLRGASSSHSPVPRARPAVPSRVVRR